MSGSGPPSATPGAEAYAREKQLQRLNENKNALLETLALAYQRYDKGTIDQELFGLVLERLQHFLEAEAEVEAGMQAGTFASVSPLRMHEAAVGCASGSWHGLVWVAPVRSKHIVTGPAGHFATAV